MCVRFCLVFLVFVSLWAEVSSGDTSTPPENSPPYFEEQKNGQMTLPPELLQKWNEYDQQYKTSMLSLEQFLDQVEALGINFESLPGFMTHLVDSYKNLEAERLQERAAYQQELKTQRRKALFYKVLSLVGGVTSVIFFFL